MIQYMKIQNTNFKNVFTFTNDTIMPKMHICLKLFTILFIIFIRFTLLECNKKIEKNIYIHEGLFLFTILATIMKIDFKKSDTFFIIRKINLWSI